MTCWRPLAIPKSGGFSNLKNSIDLHGRILIEAGMKKIGGVSVWIWGIGCVVILCAALSAISWVKKQAVKNSGSPEPAVTKLEEKNHRKPTSREYAEQCFQAILELDKYDLEELRKEPDPALPLGDREEIEKRRDALNKEFNIVVEKRKAAENGLVDAEKIEGKNTGYTKALKNFHGELIKRNVVVGMCRKFKTHNGMTLQQAESLYHDLRIMDFDQAVEFGNSISTINSK